MNDEPKTPLRTGQGMDYGEQADVQQVHAAVQREKREPRVGAEPLVNLADRDLRTGDFLWRRVPRPLLGKFHHRRTRSDGFAARAEESSGRGTRRRRAS